MPRVCLKSVIVVFPDHYFTYYFPVTSVSSDLWNVMRSKCAMSTHLPVPLALLVQCCRVLGIYCDLDFSTVLIHDHTLQ